MNNVMQRIRQSVVDADGPCETDADLLVRFLAHSDSRALSVLIGRHAPMVWGVCRRILAGRQDAEDAFQAAFLVLFRKASTIKPRSMVGNWLYGVAFQTALKARATIMKRNTREKPTSTLPEPPAKTPADHPLLAFLDEELNRLPDKYRVVLVLCDLHGKTRAEAARELGWVEGTVASRLARGRRMLAERLGRHGAVVSAAAISALLANSFVSAAPVSVVAAAVQAATKIVAAKSLVAAGLSQQAIILAEGVVKTMLLSKLKIMGVTLTIAVLACFGIGSAIQMYAGERGAGSGRNPLPLNGAGNDVQQKKPPGNQGGALPLKDDPMQGSWIVVKAERGGREAVADLIKSVRVVIQGNTLRIFDDRRDESATFKIDSAKRPREIDLVFKLAPENNVERAALGIYELNADSLKLAWRKDEGPRPTEFASIKGERTSELWILKREMATKVPGDKAKAEVAPQSDMDKIQGKWLSVACEMQGTEFTGKQLQDFRFDPSFDGKNFVVRVGTIRMEGTFELNPTSNPKTITLKGVHGTNLGIYTFDGDQLRICICDTKKEGRRPTEFKTTADSGHSLILFKRVSRESVSRENEVRGDADRFLKTALAGETEKVRALAAPAVSDQQLARFKGLTKTLPIANVYVTAGAAPTSHGNNAGRALVVTDEIEVADGTKRTKGRVVLTFLKDDARLKTKGWLVWDIDLRDDVGVAKEVKAFIDRYQPKQEAPSVPMVDAAQGAAGVR